MREIPEAFYSERKAFKCSVQNLLASVIAEDNLCSNPLLSQMFGRKLSTMCAWEKLGFYERGK